MSETRALGFRQTPDSRDFLHPLRVNFSVSDRPVVVRWKPGVILDQGSEGACVGFACKQLAQSDPIPNKGGPTAREVYLEARMIDEFDDSEEGTSVRAGMNILRKHGLITGYKWAPNVETLADYVRAEGGAVAGTNWYSYQTDFSGRMLFTGRPVGGHAWYISGVDVKERVFFAVNSWGRSFGRNGEFWVTFDDLARMMRLGGSVAVASEKLLLASTLA